MRAITTIAGILFAFLAHRTGTPGVPRSTCKTHIRGGTSHDFTKQIRSLCVAETTLELQLKDSKQAGLGRKREAITARFLETLVATDQGP